MEKFDQTPHPNGGFLHWYRVGGRVFSILDNGYEHADDFEVWERDPDVANADPATGILGVIPGTEQRAGSMKAAEALIAATAEPDPVGSA